jgi:hypothetical protein
MTIPPAVVISAAVALIRKRSDLPAVADWLEEQAAMTSPSPGALRVSLTYLSEGAP